MTTIKHPFLMVMVGLFLLSPFSNAMGGTAEFDFGFELYESLISENNLYDTENASGFVYDSIGNETVFSPYAEVSFGDFLSAFFLSNLSYIHYFDDHENDSNGELASAFFCLRTPRFQLSAGVQPFLIGRSLIYDENEPGLTIDVHMGSRFTINAGVAALDHSSSLWSVNVGYRPGLFEKIEMFFAFYNAGEGAFSRNYYAYDQRTIFNNTVWIDLPSNSGEMIYAGGGIDVFVFGAYVRFTTIIQNGQMTFSSEKGRVVREIDVTSFITDLEISRNIGDFLSCAMFVRAMSGGPSDLGKDELRCYITPLPLSLRSLVFANDQFVPEENRDGLVSRTMTLAGLVSPGLSVSWTPTDDVIITSLATLLYPYEQHGDHQAFYGWEWDIRLSWNVKPWLDYSFAAGYFRHGDVFKDEQGETPPPASRVITGITLRY